MRALVWVLKIAAASGPFAWCAVACLPFAAWLGLSKAWHAVTAPIRRRREAREQAARDKVAFWDIVGGLVGDEKERRRER